MRGRRVVVFALVLLSSVTLLFLQPSRIAAQSCLSSIVISQVYGGGGNQGATLTNDFIELFNRSNTAVSITGWTVQYASASGYNWQRTELNGIIQPGHYYLVQEKQGNGGTVSLPIADAEGGIGLSATSGKVALVSSLDALSGTAPTGLEIIDLVGYGDATFAEGNPTEKLSNTTAAFRESGGCSDTGSNWHDFYTGSPNPRNSQWAHNLCGIPIDPHITAAGIGNAASYESGFVSPGEIIVIYGTGFGPSLLASMQLTPDGQYVTTELSGVRVLFDGYPSPMVYAVENQVSAVVPYFIAGNPTTGIQVEYEGRVSKTVTLPVRDCAPGILTLDGSGQGQGAILNLDYSVNGPSNPIEKGSYVMIYATGGGVMVPPAEDGQIVTSNYPEISLPVKVFIGGVQAEVTYAGAAPWLINGAIQLNAKVPENLASNGAMSVRFTVGEDRSQQGVILWVAGDDDGDIDPAIEDKYSLLKNDPSIVPLPEIPHDQVGLPSGWLGLISWNIQVGCTSTDPSAARPPMVQDALSKMFLGSYQVLAAQEISNSDSSDYLRDLLPGGNTQWLSSFFDTNDSMDNGFWYSYGITLQDDAVLFVTDEISNGKIIKDESRAVHPPVVARFAIDDFDFTLFSLHLTYASGNTSESARELRNILDYVEWYFNQPNYDPDVVICGDFNIPSLLSGQTGQNGITLDSVFDNDPRFQSGHRRFVVTVHEPTSRSLATNGGTPANNYDHCICSIDTLEEFIEARRVATDILTDHPDDPEVRLTSDHFPIIGFFRTIGEGITLDGPSLIY